MAKTQQTRRKQRDKADRLFSLYIRARDRVCQKCGASKEQGQLQCAHIFGRRYFGTRWDPDNAVCLCAGCHKSFTHDPIRWEDWCIERMGEAKYLEVRARAQAVTKPDYEAIIYRLEEALG